MTLDPGIEQRLRHGLRARANRVPLPHLDEPPGNVVALRLPGVARHRAPAAITALVVAAAVVSGVIGAVAAGPPGGHPPAARSAARPSSSPSARTHSPTAPGLLPSAGGAVRSGAPPQPLPCPADVTVPTMASGRYCGPPPPAGNGLGPGGLCTGEEAIPPCGAGVVVGRYYAYTVPDRCDGLIVFDGMRWVSELPPPVPVPDFDVWMRLDPDGTLRSISPTSAVSFVPYQGQPLSSCAATVPLAPGSR